MRARVKPGHASAHYANVQLLALEISAVDVGDLQFAAFRRLKLRGDFDYLLIVKIESGDRVTRLRVLRFLFNAERLAVRIELDYAVTLRVIDGVSKDSGSFWLER